MVTFFRKIFIVLDGLNVFPLSARGIRAGMIMALNMSAEMTARCGVRCIRLSAPSSGSAANIIGTITKYFAMSFAMLKVVTIYGLGGIVLPFIGIKLIAILITVLRVTI